MKTQAYATTKVSVLQSLEEIRKMIMGHGGVGFRYTQVPEGITIEWGWTRKGQNFLARLPVKFNHAPKMTAVQMEQEERTKVRSLMYYLKATYDAIDKGIVLQEQAFMGDLIMRLPNGGTTRVMDALLPQIASGQAVNADLDRLMLSEGPKESTAETVEAEIVDDPEILRRLREST